MTPPLSFIHRFIPGTSPEAPLLARLTSEGRTVQDLCAALLLHLRQYATLLMALYSGGKSLHGFWPAAGVPDGVLAKFSPQGTHLAGTFFGGTSSDNFQGVLVGPGDTIYVAGTTQSSSLAGVTGTVGGMADFFTTRFADDLHTQLGGVRLGGSADDEGRNIALGPSGTWYAGGITRSTDWPTVNAGGAHYGGGKEDGVFIIVTP